MKILITTDWYAPIINGVITSVLNLENELRKNGHDVKILTLSQNHNSYVSGNVTYIGSYNADWVYTGARMKMPSHSEYTSALLSWKPDIIHSQCEFSTFLYAVKIAEILNIPIVHTYHTVYEDYTHYFSHNKKLGKRAVSRFSKLVSDYCEKIIAPTQKVKGLLESYKIDCPVSIIPTGIALDKFYSDDSGMSCEIRNKLGISDDDFTAVYIGRLAKEKNIDELIKMQYEINNPNVKLLIVGDGPYREELEKLTRRYALSAKVIFAGMVKPEEVVSYYKCGNVFVSASTSETQGLTYIEALASGLPVLCRKDDCLDGVIDDNINGLQYENPDEYCRAIKKFSENKNFLNEMSCNALNSSRIFSCEIFGKRVEEVYREAIENYRNNKEFSIA